MSIIHDDDNNDGNYHSWRNYYTINMMLSSYINYFIKSST